MLLLLLLPFLLHLLGARDVPKDTRYVIKKITTCPDVGYFFRRDFSPNSLQLGPCYLCFCQDDGTALCWKRENKRCDASSYKHHDMVKRDTRVRRSPFSLGDIFFRDAAQDLTSKKEEEQCKPFESTFSDDCPPADWCIGCTVCDCDARGHWDCHLLSFCPDKNNKMKTAKKPLKGPKKAQMKNSLSKPTKTTTGVAKPQRTTKTTSKPLRRPNRQVQNKKTSPRAPYQKSKSIKKSNNPSPKPLIIRKGTVTKKPITLKSTENSYNLKKSDRDFITREIMKNVVTVMRRMLNNSQAINNQLLKVLPNPKSIQKRSMDKRKHRKHFKKYKPPSSKKSQYNKPVPAKQNKTKQTKPVKIQKSSTRRYKRQVPHTVTDTTTMSHSNINNTDTEKQRLYERSALSSAITEDNYYKYYVVTEKPNTNKTEQQNYRIIYAESYNDSYENEVQQFSKKEKDFDIVAMNDLEQVSKVPANVNKKVKESTIPKETVNDTNKVTIHNESRRDNLRHTNDKLITDTTKSIRSTSFRPFIMKNVANFGNITTTVKSKVRSKDVTRVLNPRPRKYTTTKKVNTLKRRFKNIGKVNGSVPVHSEKSLKSRMFKKIADIQNVFKKLLNDFRLRNKQTNTTTAKPNRKKFNIMKYLKTFFKKVFRRRPGKDRISINGTVERNKLRSHVIEAICEIFDNCVINKRNKKPLESKINELYTESNNIFRSIKIIKGLLHLIDINNALAENSSKPYFKDDIHKINYILKDQYENSRQKLTESQLTQIKYIKNNTHVFIQSVGKFANILNDIIAMLTKDVNKHKTDPRNRRNTKRYKFPDSNLEVTKDFTKLKNILKKYNLVQNTFMRKMYDTLNKFGNTQDNNTLPQVSHENNEKFNASVGIELFSRNIIENLRKLKNLAEMLNSRSRKKRNVGDEDTLEYLLTLMEYMLKQSYPLDATPVNDGIDLLIDAIKSAPDIKPIRKKVLESMSSPNIRIGRTTEAPHYQIFDDDLSDSNRVAKEDNFTFISTISAADMIGQGGDQNKADDYKYQHVDKNIFDENTESVYYVRDFSTSSTSDPNEKLDTTLPNTLEKKSEEDQKDSGNFDKFENKVTSSSKKFEVFSEDMEEDESNVEVTSTTIAPETEIADLDKVVETTTETPVATTEMKLAEIKEKQISKAESSDSSDGDKRVSLDWLDEGYDQEVKDAKVSVENVTLSTVTVAPLSLSTSQKTILQKEENVVSSITKEFSEEDDKKNQAKWNAEHLMRQKQMDLLNSLDYGTEKSEIEDSADPKEEKDDAFSSYYS